MQNMKFTANISNVWAKNLLSDDYKVWDSNFKARSDWRELCTYYTCVHNYGVKGNDNKKKNWDQNLSFFISEYIWGAGFTTTSEMHCHKRHKYLFLPEWILNITEYCTGDKAAKWQ